jgi:ankyrin repeat protein
MKKKNKRTSQVIILLALLITQGLFAQNTTEVPLIRAVLYHISEVEKVLAEGVDINQQDEHGFTALMWLCSASSDEKCRETAKLLIAKGADVNIKAKNGSTALIEAAANSQEIFDILVAKGADIKDKRNDQSGTFYQCMLGIIYYDYDHMGMAKYLLENGASVDDAPVSGGAEGFTPLIYAVRSNKLDIAKFLIENGANVNAKNVKGQTPLSLAEGKLEMANLLKANGAKKIMHN